MEIVSYEFNSKTYNNKTGDQGKEIIEDRNIYTKKRYKNIFELRHTKIKWMIEDLPNKVKNYIFIRYEELINNFDETLIKIKDKGLQVKKNIDLTGLALFLTKIWPYIQFFNKEFDSEVKN